MAIAFSQMIDMQILVFQMNKRAQSVKETLRSETNCDKGDQRKRGGLRQLLVEEVCRTVFEKDPGNGQQANREEKSVRLEVKITPQ